MILSNFLIDFWIKLTYSLLESYNFILYLDENF